MPVSNKLLEPNTAFLKCLVWISEVYSIYVIFYQVTIDGIFPTQPYNLKLGNSYDSLIGLLISIYNHAYFPINTFRSILSNIMIYDRLVVLTMELSGIRWDVSPLRGFIGHQTWEQTIHNFIYLGNICYSVHLPWISFTRIQCFLTISLCITGK